MLKYRHEFNALYDQAPGFIATSEGPDHIFSFANASYKRLVGRDDLVGRTVADALPEIVEQGFIEQLDRVFQTGQPFLGDSLPIRLHPPATDQPYLRYIKFVYQPIRDDNDSIIGLFCEGYDVTAERAAADEMATLQAELIHLSRVNAMGAMATTLAHELNQPLTAISSFVAGCKRLIDPDAPNADAIRAALCATEEASQHAGDIIRHLRELTRRGAPTKKRFELKPAIAECLRLVASGRNDGIELHDRTPAGLMITADRVQIQQVMINVLRNACDAVATASHRLVTVTADNAGGKLTVSVTDTGEGVHCDAAREIFSWTDSNKEGGMGLGLSISRTIIESHRGRIWLDRSDRNGSTFCFSVPDDAALPRGHAGAVS